MAQPSNQTPEFQQYNATEQALLAQALAFAVLYFSPWLDVPMTDVQWFSLVEQLFPYVKSLRDLSAVAARRYYDEARAIFVQRSVIDLDRIPTQRSSEVPGDKGLEVPQDDTPDRHDIFLADYEPVQLRRALEEVRHDFKKEVTQPGASTRAAAAIGREVLNGGRSTLIQAVPEDGIVQGWARVQGGGESCAFCWMLISRGPVYTSQDSAGDIGIEMEQWHPNCDCQVVPVFDRKGEWPGKDDWKEAEELWKEVTKGLSASDNDSKTGETAVRSPAYKAFRKALADGVKGPGNSKLPVPQTADKSQPFAA